MAKGAKRADRQQATSHVMMALRGMTPRGRAFLAAGVTAATAGILFDQRDLVRIGVLLLALPIAAALFLTRARYRISAHRRVDRSRAEAGSVVRVEVDVRNLSRLTSPLLLAQDALPPELGVARGEGARFVLERIAAHGDVTVTYAIRPEQRGRYTVGPLSVRLADPFGFCQILRTFSVTDRLSVLPATVALSATRLGGAWNAGGETRQRGMTTGGEPDVTTRPYLSGDDRRHVHWRTTARTGELAVRREEQPWQSRATLLVDTRAGAHNLGERSASFEFAISMAASVASGLVRGGYGVRLVDDVARILAESHTTPGEAGYAILDALSDLERSRNSTLLPVAARLVDETGGRGSIIAVLGRLSGPDATALARTSPQGVRRLAVLVDPDAGPVSAGPGRLAGTAGEARDILRRAGWSVVIARPGTSIESVWWELNAGDPLDVRRWVG
jgi:uncharacterized protein (DUF58 family)